jgi:hypothetical protein
MSFMLPIGKSSRFNPPPNWPAPPPGWTPSPGWAPDPSWPPPPEGWQLWIDDPGSAGTPLPHPQQSDQDGNGRHAAKKTKIIAWSGAAAVVLISVVVVSHATSGSSSLAYECDYNMSPADIALALPSTDNVPNWLYQNLDVLDTYCPGGPGHAIGSADPAETLFANLTLGSNNNSNPNAGDYYSESMSYYHKYTDSEKSYCTISFTVGGNSYTESVWATTDMIGQAACSALGQ